MKKNIKFIYVLLIITILGSGMVFFLQNKITENNDSFSINENINSIKNNVFNTALDVIFAIDNKKEKIDKLENDKELFENKKIIENSSYESGSKIIYTDKDGKILKYKKEIGGEDSALVYSFYYDENGKLFFVSIDGGAVNGSEMLHEIYYNSIGKKISESHKITKGEGYTWPKIWPEDEIVFNPKNDFEH